MGLRELCAFTGPVRVGVLGHVLGIAVKLSIRSALRGPNVGLRELCAFTELVRLGVLGHVLVIASKQICTEGAQCGTKGTLCIYRAG